MGRLLWAVLLLLPWSAQARRLPELSSDELAKRADLIVIADPLRTVETREKVWIVYDTVIRPGFPSPGFDARGLETSFHVASVLKGDPQIREFVLHYYRAIPQSMYTDTPGLVSFLDGNAGAVDSFDPRYLLYLKKDPDGRYEAVTGQTDPIYSVRILTIPAADVSKAP